MEILKPEELKEKFNDPWVAPYQKVLNDANILTGDLGGSATTMELASEVKNNL